MVGCRPHGVLPQRWGLKKSPTADAPYWIELQGLRGIRPGQTWLQAELLAGAGDRVHAPSGSGHKPEFSSAKPTPQKPQTWRNQQMYFSFHCWNPYHKSHQRGSFSFSSFLLSVLEKTNDTTLKKKHKHSDLLHTSLYLVMLSASFREGWPHQPSSSPCPSLRGHTKEQV